jgi:hypothetical protein
LKAFRPKEPSEEEEKQRKRAEILARVEEARKKQAEEKAAAQAIVDQVNVALQTLASSGLDPLDLLSIVGIIMYTGEHAISERLHGVMGIFDTILELVGGPFLQRARAICQCRLCWVQYFMQMFDPNPDPNPEIDLDRLFWRRAFGIQDFREDLSSFGGQIFRFLRFQEERILTTIRLERLFSLMVVDLGGGFGGGHRDPPPRAPKAMPPIVPESKASPFEPCSLDCVICMGQLSGQCLMPQCRHALHSRCMSAMFESGIDLCPSCRVQIQTLVRKTLEESPKPSDESPKASDDSSAGGASAGGASGDTAPESPNASEE